MTFRSSPPLHPSLDNRPAGGAEQSCHSSTGRMPLTALRLRTQTAATSTPQPELGVTPHNEGQGDRLAAAGPLMQMDDGRPICPAAQCRHPGGFFFVSKGVPAQPRVDDITSALVGVMQSECKSDGVQVIRGVCLCTGKTRILTVHSRVPVSVLFYHLFSVAGLLCRTTAVILAQYVLMTRLSFFLQRVKESHCPLLSKNPEPCLALCLQPPDLLTSL